MNEMKEELMIMEETAADQPFPDPRLEDKITEMRQRIVEREPMTMNEMKAALAQMVKTYGEQSPNGDIALLDKMLEMQHRIWEWEEEMLPW